MEFLFLIDNHTDETVNYFEMLAVTSYFLITNLGETKLSYMAIRELQGWFDDKSRNGFKIDGLAEGAGNIPTGNSPQNVNHFIVTPSQLAERYKNKLDNPDANEALRGDLTAMLTYTQSIYSYRNKQTKLLQVFQDSIKSMKLQQNRKGMNMKMLKADADKFNFIPDDNLSDKGFNADVKKELYRFPSILLLDICIVNQCNYSTSWQSLERLGRQSLISSDFSRALRFLLAAATYIRLSAYLYHDAHDDRISLLKGSSENTAQDKHTVGMRWFLPCHFFSAVCRLMIPVKLFLAEQTVKIEDLTTYQMVSDVWWLNVTSLYYSGNYVEALSVLKQKCEGLSENPVTSALQLASELPHSIDYKLYIISETLFWCSEYRAALQIYQYMTDNDISDKRVRIAACHIQLSNYNKALEILESIPVKSSEVYLQLGHAYGDTGKYDQAEAHYLHALQIEYNKTSVDTLTDYYGNPLPVDDKQDGVDLISAASPEHRLSMITNITPDIITRIGSLGMVYLEKKQYRRAEAYYNKAVELIHELYGKGAAVEPAATALINQGANYRHMKQYSDANQCYTEALAVYRQLSKGNDTEDIAKTLYNQGNNYHCMKRYSNADQCFTETLAIYRKLSPRDDTVDIANTLNNQGVNYNEMKQYSNADQCYTEALAIYRKLSPDDDTVDIANTLYNQGKNYADAGDEGKAREKAREALNIYKRLDPDNPQITKIQDYLS